MSRNAGKLLVSVGGMVAGLMVSGGASAVLFQAEVQTLLGNSTGPYSTISVVDAYDFSLGGVASINDSKSFSAVDSSGNATTVSFEAQATAQAGDSGLKIYTTINVSNPVTIGTNTPYIDSTGTHYFFDPVTNEPLPSGVPTRFDVVGRATANDTITIAADGVSYVKLKLGLSGSVSKLDQGNLPRDIQSGLVGVYQNEGGADEWDSQLYAAEVNGDFLSTDIWTNSIAVLGGQAVYDIVFNVNASVEPWIYDMSNDGDAIRHIEGGTYGVTADFSHTLNILEVYGYDSNGNQVNLDSAIGSGGTHYNIAAVPVSTVPEPETYAMMLAGLGIVSLFARRRQNGNKNSPYPGSSSHC